MVRGSASLPAVLLVDDRPQNLVALRAVLDGFPAELVSAASGHEAIAAASQREFAVILLDLMMPDIDGLQTAARIRALPGSLHVPIIFLTAAGDRPEFVSQAYAAGAVDFLQKPFDPAALRAKVAVFVELFARGERLREEVEERARAEAARQESERQRAALQKLTCELQRALAIKDEFLSIASHELRTPLSPMLLQLETLGGAVRAAGCADERVARKIAILERQARRLTRLVDALLDVARFSKGVLALQLEPCDLGQLVTDTVALLTEESAGRKTTIELDIPESIPGVWDPVRVQQILFNLLANSLRYGMGRPIAMSVTANDDEVRITVTDQGMGIPQEHQERIFGRFERAASRNYGGLGLGLYLAKTIAETHGGSIEVASEVGQGARFTVRLPRVTEEPCAPSATA